MLYSVYLLVKKIDCCRDIIRQANDVSGSFADAIFVKPFSCHRLEDPRSRCLASS